MGAPNPTFYLVVLLTVALTCAFEDDSRKLPDGFLLGTATASYQVEGAWNIGGKGVNIWDQLMLDHPDFTDDHQWGDVACDSYHNIKRDVEMLKELGMEAYRFSLSWSRILPTGYNDVLNQEGVDYYNNLITSLQAANITPVVTIYHWDLPQPLQDIGGWANPLMANYYKDYAETCFKHFGTKVKIWITFNEPLETCLRGYAEGVNAPALRVPGVGEYLCAHNILRAHAMTYRMFHSTFIWQEGKMGITLNSRWMEPKDNTPANVDAASRAMEFELGWFAHPIFAKSGNYPSVMMERIAAASLAQGLSRSRLPTFTSQELNDLQGSADFFGLNHYSTSLLEHVEDINWPVPSNDNDLSVRKTMDPSWPGSASSWLKVVPWGLRKLINWIKTEYDNPPIYITENGFSDDGQLDDKDRIEYHRSYMLEMLNAIYKDKCNVIGYTAWSLMDNFEWKNGYTKKFGLYQVNFTDPARTRTPKSSVAFFQEMAKTRRIPEPKADTRNNENLAESCSNKEIPCTEEEHPSVTVI